METEVWSYSFIALSTEVQYPKEKTQQIMRVMRVVSCEWQKVCEGLPKSNDRYESSNSGKRALDNKS